MSTAIAIVSTGTANIASVQAALLRLACVPELTSDAEHIRLAPLLVLPGVGAFAAAMSNLQDADVVSALRERVRAGRPTLCICLGMQLLACTSAESPGIDGLQILPADVTRLSADQRVPQMGWNQVRADDDTAYLTTGYAYFANSYAIDAGHAAHLRAAGWRLAITSYGQDMVAACEREGVLACQFHPELSGPWGHGLLARWLERSHACAGANGGRITC